MPVNESAKAYICGIAWQHELDPDVRGCVKIYPNIESLKDEHPMWMDCGIVEIELSEVRWVTEQNIETFPPK